MYEWKFFKAGRMKQVCIDCGDDIANLKNLNQKQWTVLASAIDGLRFPQRTLQLLDTDGDGRVRAPEVIAAAEWLKARLVSLDWLFNAERPVDALPFEQISDATAEGKALKEAAKRIAAESSTVTLGDVAHALSDLESARLSPEDAAALKAWEDEPKNNAAILPLGDATASAAVALDAVLATIDEFFAVPDDMPLVTEDADKLLPLTKNLNPKFSDAIAAFAAKTVRPLLKDEAKDTLARSEWNTIKAMLAPYKTWANSKPVAAVALKKQIEDVERAIRYTNDFVTFLRNYVNQHDLYTDGLTAIYQTGVLYIDARACELCFHVADEGAHSALSEKSNCCIVYLALTRKATGEKRNICAVITKGRTAPLYVGRNGLFYDRDFNDWDAVVTKIVEAQVSLLEAFWSPWAKLGAGISNQVKKFLSSKQEAAQPKVEEKPNPAILTSSVAALGVGVGMMGAACAGIIGLIAGMPLWKVLAGIVALVLLVSLPSVLLAWFKLRARDIGVILNASGWAVNRPLRFTASRRARLWAAFWICLITLIVIGAFTCPLSPFACKKCNKDKAAAAPAAQAAPAVR